MAQNLFKFKGFLCCFMQKRFLQTSAFSTKPTTLSSSSSSSFTVQYLINSCGLPLETALSTSKKLQLDQYSPQKHDSVLNFFKSHGFTDTHIAKLIGKCPKILLSRVDGTLRPKMNCLIESGFTGSLLPELIAPNPKILYLGLSSQLQPSLDLLKTYLVSNENVVAATKRSSWLLTNGIRDMQPNINFLISEGVPASNISKLISHKPRTIMVKPDTLVHAVKAVKQLGFQPNATMFVHAVRVMSSMSELTWKRKVEFFNSLLGWSEDDVKSAFNRSPTCLVSSEEKIKNVMDFFVNTMKVEATVLLYYPVFFKFSIDKRMRPRYNVFRILKSKKLVKEDMKIARIFMFSEKEFVNNYVMEYLNRVPNLMDLYRGNIPGSMTVPLSQ